MLAATIRVLGCAALLAMAYLLTACADPELESKREDAARNAEVARKCLPDAGEFVIVKRKGDLFEFRRYAVAPTYRGRTFTTMAISEQQ